MTTHSDVEEKKPKWQVILDNSPHLDNLSGDGWADIRQALTEMKEAGAREERKRIEKWVHEHKDLTTIFGNNQAHWYVEADELLQTLSPTTN